MKLFAEIYECIKNALEEAGIKHVDLWNRNVEFIEQETAWETPAVFVEFHPVAWDRIKEEVVRGTIGVTLHIVTRWNDSESGMAEVWLAGNAVMRATDGLSGDSFGVLRLSETRINHNHEELVETLETYTCKGSQIMRHPD